MKVYWTEGALGNLHALHEFIARQSLGYANSMVHRIINRTDSLSQHPLIGAVVPEYGAEDLRELLESPYRVIYRTLPEQIDVIAVIHGARTLPPDRPAAAD